MEASYQQAIAQLYIYNDWAAAHPQISLIARPHRSDPASVLGSWEGPREQSRRRIGGGSASSC